MSHFPRPKLSSIHVPIVGVACEAYEGSVSVAFRCKCDDDNQPRLINGTQAPAICPKCRKVYAITKVEFDVRKGHQLPAVSIEVVGHAVEQDEAEKPSELVQ